MTLIARRPGPALIGLVDALGGTWHGPTAMCRCPSHADSTPSLSIRQGDRGILVTCFAGCERSVVLRALRSLTPAPTWPTFPPCTDVRTMVNVGRLWAEAGPADHALCVAYFDKRGIDACPHDVRFHQRCPRGPRPNTTFHPALLVAVREGHSLRAVQRIFLDPQTPRCSTKMMLGRPGAGAWQGKTANEELAVAEGFETASAYMLITGRPCWAALGARRLDRLLLPSGIRTLLIAEDNDAEGHRAGDRAARSYRRPGRVIRRDPPPSGVKDWAQLLETRWVSRSRAG